MLCFALLNVALNFVVVLLEVVQRPQRTEIIEDILVEQFVICDVDHVVDGATLR